MVVWRDHAAQVHRSVVVVGYQGAELLDIACVTTTLDMANTAGARAQPYVTSVVSPAGRPIQCGNGLVLQAQGALERVRGPLDTLVVSGGFSHGRAAADPVVVGHVRRLARESRRVASVCTGASVLAAAGLLDGRRATTHWHFARELASSYPQVVVDPGPIFIRDGNVITAAGITSALDLSLALVEEDHGPDLARSVSRMLVTYLQRPGNQAQMTVFTAPAPLDHDPVRRVVEHVHGCLAADLGGPALAAVAGVTVRHLTRLFRQHLRASPAAYVRQVRTEAAAHLLESTDLPLAAVAVRVGLRTTESLRQTFLGHYGTTPSGYRATRRRAAR